MQRRTFLVTGGSTVLATLAGGTGGPDFLQAQDRVLSSIPLEQRLADVIAAYDAQGNHRTGTPVDNASAEWLSRLVQQMGVEAELESFPLSRVDPQILLPAHRGSAHRSRATVRCRLHRCRRRAREARATRE